MSDSAEADAAWVKVALPLAPQALREFLHDIERLLRINPCLEFERLTRLPDGGFQLVGRNESNSQPFATRATLVATDEDGGLALRYDQGIKRETRFEILPDPGGSVLTITEVYAALPDQLEQSLSQVDRSLLPWAAALRAHLLRRARWQGFYGYAWLVESFWLGMPPRQRRVSRMIAWTTLLEFVAFLAVLLVYVMN